MHEDANYNIVGRSLIIRLNCELDHHISEQIRKRIDNIIDTKAIKNIIFDFEKVSFMDSSGIGVVIGRLKKVKNRDGKVCITNINKRVDKVFTLSGLYKIITVYNNVNEALANI